MSCRSKTGGREADPVQIMTGWVGGIGGARQDLNLRGGSASASAPREWEQAPEEPASGGGCGGRDLMSRPEQTGGREAGPVQITPHYRGKSRL